MLAECVCDNGLNCEIDSERVTKTGMKTSSKRMKTIDYGGQRYFLASSLLSEERLRILKHQETFAVFDRHGDIFSHRDSEEGIYFEGTRFLSLLEFHIGDLHPLLLSSTVSPDNAVFAVDFTNPDFTDHDGVAVARGTIHIFRTLILFENSALERVQIRNFSGLTIRSSILYRFGADFRDIFEVRGHVRSTRGENEPPTVGPSSLRFGYTGLDRVSRHCEIRVSHDAVIDHNSMDIPFQLGADSIEFYLSYDFMTSEKPRSSNIVSARERFDLAQSIRVQTARVNGAGRCMIVSSNHAFNAWINQSVADLEMLTTQTNSGPYPYAGIPWFSAPFGRDGLITALQLLWVDSKLARGVLQFLADHQATEASDVNDSEPGKILHESRRGELARLHEIPFERYYGSIDSTPLFVILAGEYFKVTADQEFIESLWPHIEAALNWMDRFGDRDGDGFIEYERSRPSGLINQGWKDSHDSIFHRDGTSARPPIALCEVQGYACMAKMNAAVMARELGHSRLADEWERQAAALKAKFNQAFWSNEIRTFSIALDGDKNPCSVRSSNVGHCLFTGIVDDDRAARIAETLMSSSHFSGWGIRTIAQGEPNYNPMSYHNGSVWPHDTALAAAGLSRYGFKEAACRLMTGLFEASTFLELNRLPELFCGFDQRYGQGPTLYPMSCAPQAWAAGAPFMLLQACLGITIDGANGRVIFDHPALPPWLERLNLYGLKVGRNGCIDLEIIRHRQRLAVSVLKRSGNVSVVVTT